ncbi:hypothetical protein BDZ97DRAFT_1759088 [Flammula alnicola]|nr:hypothetical protein BDZ97DRAFT_1759088 [Flammula alnicola]
MKRQKVEEKDPIVYATTLEQSTFQRKVKMTHWILGSAASACQLLLFPPVIPFEQRTARPIGVSWVQSSGSAWFSEMVGADMKNTYDLPGFGEHLPGSVKESNLKEEGSNLIPINGCRDVTVGVCFLSLLVYKLRDSLRARRARFQLGKTRVAVCESMSGEGSSSNPLREKGMSSSTGSASCGDEPLVGSSEAQSLHLEKFLAGTLRKP